MPRRILISALLLAAVLSGCDDKTPVKHAQSDAALAAANALNFHGHNAEIDNIVRRLELTSQPGVRGQVTLYTQSGPVAKYEVLGKVTSSAKRLTSPEDCNGNGCFTAANDEGTFGSSDPYTYFCAPCNALVYRS